MAESLVKLAASSLSTRAGVTAGACSFDSSMAQGSECESFYTLQVTFHRKSSSSLDAYR